MDTMTFTKAIGALCGAWLILLLGKWAAEELYHVGGHGEQAYVIETGAEDDAAGAEEEEAGPTIIEVMASADPEAGANVFKKCQSCHKVEDGANATGPYLYGVVGRAIAAVDGFGYSDALGGKEGDWNVENLSAFLEAPRDWAPGTTMGFAGLNSIEDRADVIAYLDSTDGEMTDYAALAAAAAPAREDAAAADQDGADEEAGGQEEVAAESDADAAPEADAAAADGETDAAADEEAAADTETDAGADEEAAAAESDADAGAEEQVAAAEVEADATAEEETAADEAGSAILASADPEAGERVFRKCQACHKIEEGANGVGPHLYGVVGRDIASVDDFGYSDALSGKDGVWDAATLDAFLLNPREWAPGTKMSFAGLRKEEERADVIAYLNSIGG